MFFSYESKFELVEDALKKVKNILINSQRQTKLTAVNKEGGFYS